MSPPVLMLGLHGPIISVILLHPGKHRFNGPLCLCLWLGSKPRGRNRVTGAPQDLSPLSSSLPVETLPSDSERGSRLLFLRANVSEEVLTANLVRYTEVVGSVRRQMGKRCSGKGTRAGGWETLLGRMQRRGMKDVTEEWVSGIHDCRSEIPPPSFSVRSYLVISVKAMSGEWRMLKLKCNARNWRLECHKRKVRK